VWGEHKPAHLISQFVFIVQVFLFGTIGAALVFTNVKSVDVGKAILCIICGQSFRFLGVLMISRRKPYTFKESIFLAAGFMPKSNSVSSVGAIMYNSAMTLGPAYADMQMFGN